MLIIRFFSDSLLTVFQSLFLREGNVVFFSDKIFFIIAVFNFFFLCFISSVSFEWVKFRILSLCGSFWLERSYFKVVSVSIIVLGSCCLDSLFLF